MDKSKKITPPKPMKPAPLKRQDGGDKLYQKLREVPGHPLQIFYLENEAVKKQLAAMRSAVKKQKDVAATLDKTRQIAVHYAKKGDLLYPVLKTVYGFPGPSDMMWGVDDDVRDDLKQCARDLNLHPEKAADADWQAALNDALDRAEDMCYKEDAILYPLCAKHFTQDDWRNIARDHQDYEFCLIDPVPAWNDAETTADSGKDDAEIYLPSGHFTPAQLDAMLNTIPMELTFVDADDTNRYFNQNDGHKLFKRPLAALDRKVYTCHPPKIEPIVRGIIQDFKDGKRDSIEVWNERGGQPVLVRYMAVRNRDKNYIGTLECVQPMGFAKEHFDKVRS